MFCLKELIEKTENYFNDKIFELNVKNDSKDKELEYVWLKI